MADGGDALTARILGGITEIAPEIWNDLATSGGARPLNPFIDHRFVQALEASGSVGPGTGWTPAHIVIEDAAGRILSAAPMYLKGHSQGEYVFDHAWADAYERAGGRYYPKAQISTPFTPVTTPKLLTHTDDYGARTQIARAAAQIADRIGVSSAHMTFLSEEEKSAAAQAGFLIRMDQQYHWINRGYGSFDAFLEALSSRKRKAIRKERARARHGVVIERLSGADLREAHWDAFWTFYQDTGARKWGRPYLTRDAFSRLSETMSENIMLLLARKNGQLIAGALNVLGPDALYGRYWGCTEHIPFLHFELCYYQAIEIAIERGLGRVEAGAQGEHKLARGYEPTPVYSAHWIRDENFRRAVTQYLDMERHHVAGAIEALAHFTPFKKG